MYHKIFIKFYWSLIYSCSTIALKIIIILYKFSLVSTYCSNWFLEYSLLLPFHNILEYSFELLVTYKTNPHHYLLGFCYIRWINISVWAEMRTLGTSNYENFSISWHSLLYEILTQFYTFTESYSISFVRCVSFLVFTLKLFKVVTFQHL